MKCFREAEIHVKINDILVFVLHKASFWCLPSVLLLCCIRIISWVKIKSALFRTASFCDQAFYDDKLFTILVIALKFTFKIHLLFFERPCIYVCKRNNTKSLFQKQFISYSSREKKKREKDMKGRSQRNGLFSCHCLSPKEPFCVSW